MLAPSVAAIPAPITYIRFVAVRSLVVGFLLRAIRSSSCIDIASALASSILAQAHIIDPLHAVMKFRQCAGLKESEGLAPLTISRVRVDKNHADTQRDEDLEAYSRLRIMDALHMFLFISKYGWILHVVMLSLQCFFNGLTLGWTDACFTFCIACLPFFLRRWQALILARSGVWTCFSILFLWFCLLTCVVGPLSAATELMQHKLFFTRFMVLWRNAES